VGTVWRGCGVSRCLGWQPLAVHVVDGTAAMVPTPPLVTGAGQFSADTALAANNVWAVGSLYSSNLVPLVEHWNGVRWRVSFAPKPGQYASEFFAVDASGPDNVWAVGATLGSSISGVPMAERFDGRRWMAMRPPRGAGELLGVAAVAPNDVWVAGGSVLHFDGAHWTDVQPPRTRGDFFFAVASVPRSHALWLLGEDSHSLAIFAFLREGGAWHRKPVRCGGCGGVVPPASTVAVVSPTDAWWGGLHWDGTAWRSVNSGLGETVAAPRHGRALWGTGGTFYLTRSP
jgi:hypothetical protein